MANRPRVTYHDVEQAILQLEAAGKEVTIVNVKGIKGGGTDQVSQMIRDVMNNRLEAERARMTIGNEVMVALSREVGRQVTSALAVVTSHLEHAKRMEAELRDEIKELVACNDTQADEIAALRLAHTQTCAQAENDRIKAAADIAAKEQQLLMRMADLDEVRDELIAARTEIARLLHLDKAVSDLNSALDKARNDLRDAEKRAVAAEARLDEHQRLNPPVVPNPPKAKTAS